MPGQLVFDGRTVKQTFPLYSVHGPTDAQAVRTSDEEEREPYDEHRWHLATLCAPRHSTRTASRSPPLGGAPVGRVMFTSGGRMMCMTGDGRQEVPADQVREYTGSSPAEAK